MRTRTVFMIACMLLACAAVQAAPIRLCEVTGLVERCASDGVWAPCASGTSLEVGDLLRCSPAGAAGLLYADGTQLRVKGDTLLQFIAGGYRLRYGDTWVRVVKQGTEFRTLTPNAVVSVRGTIYSVSTPRLPPGLNASLIQAAATRSFVGSVPRAHLAGGSVLLSMLNHLSASTSVHVFRGLVSVAPIGANDVPVAGKQILLAAGHQTLVQGEDVAGDSTLAVEDYKEWGIGYRKLLMGADPAAPAVAPLLRDGCDGGAVQLLGTEFFGPRD